MFKVNNKVATDRRPDRMGTVLEVSTARVPEYRVRWDQGPQWGWYPEASLIEWDGDRYGMADTDGYGNGI